VDLEQRIRRGFNSKKGKKTYALFLDISKAYDVVWIPGLLKKLAKLGISGNILGWLKNFLTDRSFCVRIGNVLSESRSIKTGVPQGAILSPLLFNIMLSDFPGPSRGVKVLLYADDVEADVSADSCDEAEGLLQPFLDKISAWAKKMEIHICRRQISNCCLFQVSRTSRCAHALSYGSQNPILRESQISWTHVRPKATLDRPSG
jgi:hypothetical protein